MRRTRSKLSAPLAVLAATFPAGVAAQASSPALASFGERMVGTWEADDSRHVFEWSLDGSLLKTRSYFRRDDDWVLVSEGMWFWDPTAGAIRGITVATGMPMELFEYTTELSGDTIEHTFEAHGEMRGSFVERWVFSADRYDWVVEQDGARLMGGSYRKVG